ncbi:MAG: hypothetical protein HYZ17_07665 [Betaproteobacteria bacterium]|nr:hypothetical protein [Betaproteobacteria bacterium]
MFNVNGNDDGLVMAVHYDREHFPISDPDPIS